MAADKIILHKTKSFKIFPIFRLFFFLFFSLNPLYLYAFHFIPFRFWGVLVGFGKLFYFSNFHFLIFAVLPNRRRGTTRVMHQSLCLTKLLSLMVYPPQLRLRKRQTLGGGAKKRRAYFGDEEFVAIRAAEAEKKISMNNNLQLYVLLMNTITRGNETEVQESARRIQDAQKHQQTLSQQTEEQASASRVENAECHWQITF